MLAFPEPLLKYMQAWLIESRLPAYVRIDAEGRLAEAEGNLVAYGFPVIEKGSHGATAVPLLQGLLPLEGHSLTLWCVQQDAGLAADVHIVRYGAEHWVLWLDASRAAETRGLLQQKGNELSLLRDKTSRILDQYLGHDLSETLVRKQLPFRSTGDRREATILFADIRGFTPYSERHNPEQVFQTLNAYLPLMIQPIIDEGGTVDKIIGDAVMALFGVFPSATPPRLQALRSAERIMEAVREYDSAVHTDPEPLSIGIGIATGAVALGILGSRLRRSISVIGHHVNLAARLVAHARPREILIDGNTYDGADEYRGRFSAVTSALKGMGSVLTYSWTTL